MRHLTILTTCLLLAFQTDSLMAEGIRYVHPAHHEEESFSRISEYFTGRENTGGRVILRSDPRDRAGFYFTVRLQHYPYHATPVEKAVVLDVIWRPGDAAPASFTFPLGEAPRRNPVIMIGATGADYPGPDIHPVAWRIRFFDTGGNVIAWRESYLWGGREPPIKESHEDYGQEKR